MYFIQLAVLHAIKNKLTIILIDFTLKFFIIFLLFSLHQLQRMKTEAPNDKEKFKNREM